MLGLPSRSFCTICDTVSAACLVIPAHSQVRNRVGDLGHEDLGLDVLEAFEAFRDGAAAALPILPDRGVVILEVTAPARPACR